ncbi:MAG: ABC transporter permease [Deltaproteobacteria bacterium]|nr:ABC transporter permease [Deltaproteobacteria bacterium]
MLENKNRKAPIEKSEGPLALAWKRFFKHKLARISLSILIVFVLLAVFSPWICQFLGVSYDDPSAAKFLGSSKKHIFGTDHIGRDVFARLLFGARVSLSVGLISALMAAFIGTVIGALAGYFGGFLDSILMRFTDAMMALPTLPLMILFAAVDLKNVLPFLPTTLLEGNQASILKLVIIVVFFSWMTVARLVRGSTLSLREREFVLAAQAIGVRQIDIIFRHIIPNCVAPIIVASTLSVGGIILYESVLSFLGLGIQPPMPSWGNMLTGAQDYLRSSPLLAVYPGLFILITVVAFNFIGDGLRDAFDPKFVFSKKK